MSDITNLSQTKQKIMRFKLFLKNKNKNQK